jgi:hypothetical protein
MNTGPYPSPQDNDPRLFPYQPPQRNNPPPPRPQYYQPPPPQSGQFGLPPYQPPPLLPHQRFGPWFRRQPPGGKLAIGCGIFFVFLLLFSCIVAAVTVSTTSGGANLVNATPTDTAAVQSAVNFTSTATLAPTLAPTATPTPTPKPTPKPKPACNAVNGNPWCYNFHPGNLIYSPPGSFCSYFACIGNFWNGRGYVVECNDGDYSKSGGIRGACSYHHGVWRPLYAH